MMPLGSLDFEAQLVGTVSAARTVLLPTKIVFADLPPATVIYGGGDNAIDLALGVAKFTIPVTVGTIQSDFGAQGVAFVVDGVTFSGGLGSEFQALLSTAEDLDHARVEISFAPTELGSRAEVAAPQLSSVRIDGTGTLTSLLNVILPWTVNLLSNSVLRQTLTGTGIPPILVEPNRLDFGSQSVGSSSPPLAATITNKTADDVKIGGLTRVHGIAFPDASEVTLFDLISDDCTGRTLPSGGKCQFIWRFRPTLESEVFRYRSFREISPIYQPRISRSPARECPPRFSLNRLPSISNPAPSRLRGTNTWHFLRLDESSRSAPFDSTGRMPGPSYRR